MLNSHSNNIQDMRGIAVLFVVLFHVAGIFKFEHPFAILKYGGNGVLLFFVLSGFIISSIHSGDKGLSMFVNFAIKRISRIYGPYLIPF